MGFATFTSTTSVYDHEGVGESDNGGLWASGGQVDPDNSNDWNFLFYGGAWPRPIQRAERGYTDEVLTQEFRLVSNTGDSKFDWIVGAFYMDQDTNVYQLSHNPAATPATRCARPAACTVASGRASTRATSPRSTSSTAATPTTRKWRCTAS
jgi:hypothetical protein